MGTGVAVAEQLKAEAWHAVYACRVGHVARNRMLKNAGLGVTGATELVTCKVDWKPDEDVDEARAKKLEEPLKAAISSSGELDCAHVTLIRLYKE